MHYALQNGRMGTQNSGHPPKFSDIHPLGLCMVDRGRVDECMGRILRRSWRNLGRIASRSYGRIRGNDGVRYWPRILPHFTGIQSIFSKRLMLLSLLCLQTGCLLRVSSEPLAYEGLVSFAWKVLPVSGMLELSGVLIFAVNLALTFLVGRSAFRLKQHESTRGGGIVARTQSGTRVACRSSLTLS